MIDTDKYEGHTSDWKWIDISEQDDFHLHSEYGDIINHDTPDGKLAQDAPLLLEEVKWLREDINQIPIDLLESLDLILEAHHPEVRESVMAMFGDAIGNNVVGYEE